MSHRPLRAICVEKMLGNTSSITCAFLLASDVPWLPCRAPELCGVTSTQPYHQRLDLSITKPNKGGCVLVGTNDQKTHTGLGKYPTGSTTARWWPVQMAVHSIVGVARAVPPSRSNGTGTDLQRLSTWTLRRWGKRSEPAPNSGIRALLDYAVAHGFTARCATAPPSCA